MSTEVRTTSTYNLTSSSSLGASGGTSGSMTSLSDTTPAFNPKTSADFAQHMQQLLQQLQDKFQSTSGQIFSRIDETGRSLDELEKTIADLMTEAGVEQ